MASITLTPSAAVQQKAIHASATTVPWYCWLAALSVSSAVIGVEWDISWHRSIGRDSFLTPAHVAIYLCGILAGVFCSYLILATTFGHGRLRESSVSLWGFRGPLGAFIASWGGVTMLTSAPFDDWWHGAYGLDVKVLSPPHVLLAIGIVSVAAGSLVLLAGQKNRNPGKLIDSLFLYVGALMMTALLVVAMDYFYVSMQHSGLFYRVLSMVVPAMLAALSLGSGRRWAATTVASIYFVLQVSLIWILPLFPATPKLGPVFNQVTHFIPPQFPLLLLIPAALLDTFWWHTRQWNPWRRALVSGLLFVGSAIAVQWPFSIFLQSPLARNAIFGMGYIDYLTPPTSYYARHLFTPVEKTAPGFWIEIAFAVVAAVLTSRAGLALGSWFSRVRR
jgi:hypothetical protein